MMIQEIRMQQRVAPLLSMQSAAPIDYISFGQDIDMSVHLSEQDFALLRSDPREFAERFAAEVRVALHLPRDATPHDFEQALRRIAL